MKTICDSFLRKEVFSDLKNYVEQNDFETVTLGNRVFSVLQTPVDLFNYLQVREHELILSFIRRSNIDFDTTLNIHADNIVDGRKVDLASVLYLNDSSGVTSNGTGFFYHHKYGRELPKDVSNEEYDRMINEDSNNIDCWKAIDTIGNVPNRFLLYNARLFHAKTPTVIERGDRVAVVSFYAKTK